MTLPVRPAVPLLATGALVLLAACGGGGDASAEPATSPAATPAASATTPATSPAATPAASATTPATDPAATPAASATTPAEATGTGDEVTTVDVDGDGAPDRLWLRDAADGTRTLGVTTTAHGTSSVAFGSAAPQGASASAAVLTGASPVVLLDTGRSVELYGYRVEGPGLVAVPGEDGQPYSFSLGFTSVGTGVECEAGDDGLHLYGTDARDQPDGTWTVTRTEVRVDLEHLRATNGATTTVAEGVGRDDPAVTGAHGTTCGDVPPTQVAAEDVR